MEEDRRREVARRVGGNVRRMRAALGLSQEQFAEKAGLGIKHVQAIERGEKDACASTLLKLHRALETDPGPLFARLPDSPRPVGRPRKEKP